MPVVIVDTGPLVAFLDQREAHHAWVREEFGRLRAPLRTCEIVLAETAYLLLRRGLPTERFFQLFRRNLVEVRFEFAADWENLEMLMAAYHDTPMSLADACLVRMSEQEHESVIFTLDQHFLVYRRQGNRNIPLLAPFV